MRGVRHAVERPISLPQCYRGTFRPDTGWPWLVRRIAAACDEVRYLLRIDAVSLLGLFGPDADELTPQWTENRSALLSGLGDIADLKALCRPVEGVARCPDQADHDPRLKPQPLAPRSPKTLASSPPAREGAISGRASGRPRLFKAGKRVVNGSNRTGESEEDARGDRLSTDSSRPTISSAFEPTPARAHVRSQDPGPRRCMIASRR